MENISGVGILIIMVILTIINLRIYHKFFNVIYIGSQGYMKDVLIAFFVALLEIGLIKVFLWSIFSAIFSILWFIIKVLLIIVVVAVGASLVAMLLAKIVVMISPDSKSSMDKVVDPIKKFYIKIMDGMKKKPANSAEAANEAGEAAENEDINNANSESCQDAEPVNMNKEESKL